jgi:allantoinase
MASPEYPRDPVGYAGRPPLAAWPDGARFAVSFVLNYGKGEGNGEEAKAFF